MKKTVALITREAKACPNCSARITRISGCDDMFCTDCKTAFNWRTLTIQPQGNSNPHYWDWKRSFPLTILSTETDEVLRYLQNTERGVQCGGSFIIERLRHIYLHDFSGSIQSSEEELRILRVKYFCWRA